MERIERDSYASWIRDATTKVFAAMAVLAVALVVRIFPIRPVTCTRPTMEPASDDEDPKDSDEIYEGSTSDCDSGSKAELRTEVMVFARAPDESDEIPVEDFELEAPRIDFRPDNFLLALDKHLVSTKEYVNTVEAELNRYKRTSSKDTANANAFIHNADSFDPSLCDRPVKAVVDSSINLDKDSCVESNHGACKKEMQENLIKETEAYAKRSIKEIEEFILKMRQQSNESNSVSKSKCHEGLSRGADSATEVPEEYLAVREDFKDGKDLSACDMLLTLKEDLDLMHVTIGGRTLYGFFATCSYSKKLRVLDLLRKSDDTTTPDYLDTEGINDKSSSGYAYSEERTGDLTADEFKDPEGNICNEADEIQEDKGSVESPVLPEVESFLEDQIKQVEHIKGVCVKVEKDEEHDGDKVASGRDGQGGSEDGEESGCSGASGGQDEVGEKDEGSVSSGGAEQNDGASGGDGEEGNSSGGDDDAETDEGEEAEMDEDEETEIEEDEDNVSGDENAESLSRNVPKSSKRKLAKELEKDIAETQADVSSKKQKTTEFSEPVCEDVSSESRTTGRPESSLKNALAISLESVKLSILFACASMERKILENNFEAGKSELQSQLGLQSTNEKAITDREDAVKAKDNIPQALDLRIGEREEDSSLEQLESSPEVIRTSQDNDVEANENTERLSSQACQPVDCIDLNKEVLQGTISALDVDDSMVPNASSNEGPDTDSHGNSSDEIIISSQLALERDSLVSASKSGFGLQCKTSPRDSTSYESDSDSKNEKFKARKEARQRKFAAPKQQYAKRCKMCKKKMGKIPISEKYRYKKVNRNSSHDCRNPRCQCECKKSKSSTNNVSGPILFEDNPQSRRFSELLRRLLDIQLQEVKEHYEKKKAKIDNRKKSIKIDSQSESIKIDSQSESIKIDSQSESIKNDSQSLQSPVRRYMKLYYRRCKECREFFERLPVPNRHKYRYMCLLVCHNPTCLCECTGYPDDLVVHEPSYSAPIQSRHGEASASGYGEASASGYGEASASGYGEASASGYGEASASGYGEASTSGYGEASTSRAGMLTSSVQMSSKKRARPVKLGRKEPLNSKKADSRQRKTARMSQQKPSVPDKSKKDGQLDENIDQTPKVIGKSSSFLTMLDTEDSKEGKRLREENRDLFNRAMGSVHNKSKDEEPRPTTQPPRTDVAETSRERPSEHRSLSEIEEMDRLIAESIVYEMCFNSENDDYEDDDDSFTSESDNDDPPPPPPVPF